MIERLVRGGETLASGRVPLVGLAGFVVAGCLLMAVRAADVGPGWTGILGGTLVASAYTWALAARTGGRPVLFGSLVLLVGVVVAVGDADALRTGAAVMTSVVTGVLAVMATVPAVRLLDAVREAALAVAISGAGAAAVVAFEPPITISRFEYGTLILALVCVLVLVFRLGAGFHGLGRRGLLIVVVGGIGVAATVLYGELLRTYGTPALVESATSAIDWSRDNLGASPRPVIAALGIPALVWGTHMRARRRQGWWVTAFGVTATVGVANSLINPGVPVRESALAVGYAFVLGAAIGALVIRVDLALTGPRGRRSRRAEEATALRPEPRRVQALL